jgi:hypothetical protein
MTFFQELAGIRARNAIFQQFFGEKYFKNHDIGPRALLALFSQTHPVTLAATTKGHPR